MQYRFKIGCIFFSVASHTHVRTVQVFSFGKGRPMADSLGALSSPSLPTEGGGEDSVMATAIATATSIAVAPLTAVGIVEIPSGEIRKRRINNVC